ncbi:hypothetical protein AB0M46_13520 [Dactylosporangium sp. NPDC051485]|uniref:hypothetical protein n=1 Tax=Dactylosporangium sp. NPDC051485 TaxID=3154846 RepID=UPI00342F0CA9
MDEAPSTHVVLRWQFCRGGYDITTDFYAEHDADEVRAWDYDFCFVAVVRDADNPQRWRIDSTDGRLPEDADTHRFGTPAEAVHYLATSHGLTYEFTTAEP